MASKQDRLAKLDADEAAAWSAWHASKEAGTPDVRHLQAIQKCIEKRQRLLRLLPARREEEVTVIVSISGQPGRVA